MQVTVNVPVTFFKEGNLFIAYSPVLDLSTSGKSFAIVKRRFGEAVELFIEELARMGTLDEVLSNLGWVKVNKGWQPPIPISHEVTKITLPLPH